MKKVIDVAIIGGGASGMVAAVELLGSSPELSVAILEKNEAMGRKLRATGSGRCNISNVNADGYRELLKFFARIGLMTKAYDNGLVYPYSESAADVVELLSARVCESGVDVITNAAVTKVRHISKVDTSIDENQDDLLPDDYFEITFTSTNSGNHVQEKSSSSSRRIYAHHVILALGGKASPSYGTTGDGYAIARELGHHIVTPVPALTPVECEEWIGNANASKDSISAITLAGTRTRGVVTLFKAVDASSEPSSSLMHNTMSQDTQASKLYKKVFEEAGEIQFTKFGISGICIFNMTRHMRYDRAAGESFKSFYVELDLFPDGDIRDFLRARREATCESTKASEILRTVLKENIAAYILATAENSISKSGQLHSRRRRLCDAAAMSLTDDEIEAIAREVHHLRFNPAQLRGWKEAQVTAGGVSLDEIDARTSESLIVKNLYILGELANRDFPCGGFNLTNAFLTGLHSAQDIIRKS